jgi:hypothetical protein
VFSSARSEKTVEWRPSVFPSLPHFWQSAVDMFLRSNNRKKDGKDHRYFSIVENHRTTSDKTVQRTVLYLGEINDEQQAAWVDSAALHATFPRHQAADREAEIEVAEPAATAPHCAKRE